MEGRKGYKFLNWARTYSCTPLLYFEPSTLQEIQELLGRAKRERKHVKVAGCGHSPSDIACTTDYMISLRKFNRVLEVDTQRMTVKVEAGISLAELNNLLPKHGLALSNLGSVDGISLGGAMATATHGTGGEYGVVSTHVLSLDLLVASGEVLHCSRTSNTDVFLASLCGLGSLGVVVSATVQCEAAFKLHQQQMVTTLDKVLENLEEHISACDHFRFCWYPHTDNVIYWYCNRTKRPVKKEGSWFWNYGVGYYSLEFMYWLSSFWSGLVPFINHTYYKLVYGVPAETVARSDKVFGFECLFKQYVMEWAIPRAETAKALNELKRWIEINKFPAHFPVEVRFVKKDDIWLSPAHGRDSCYINIVMYRPYGKLISHADYWAAFQKIVTAVGGRPHWAKDHTLGRDQLQELYPKFKEFAALRKKLDPTDMFMNDYLRQVFEMQSDEAAGRRTFAEVTV
ncbi:L-gulonolactone oxidase-like [Corticium candelabrum]|uniref:L-gulonolactone oxidase-like n=1 Tax=Corticium candelabrum TaxID=121492 RepID=UPI002E273D20|nr:L-gulonolactone oxidase-like [Corticium candelabrum]